MPDKVTFVSRGVLLRADLYRPALSAGARAPAVVTAPGFGGVKEMLIPRYAAALAEAGIACLAFDYAGFGESEGQPRLHVDPEAQVDAFRDALDALASYPSVDAQRLGAWGTSLSGGHTLVAAARDPRVRAAVALIPFIRAPRKPELRLTRELLADGFGRLLGRAPATIPCAGSPASRAIMRTDGAAAWMANMAKDAPRFRNEVTVASLWNMGRYATASAAKQIEIPLRLILAERDSITPAASVRAAFAGSRASHLDFVTFPETHFELFEQHLDETVRLTVDWLSRHLAHRRQAAVTGTTALPASDSRSR